MLWTLTILPRPEQNAQLRAVPCLLSSQCGQREEYCSSYTDW